MPRIPQMNMGRPAIEIAIGKLKQVLKGNLIVFILTPIRCIALTDLEAEIYQEAASI